MQDVVAIGTGFADGLKLGVNAKAAIIRIGIIEIIKFVEYFYSGIHLATFYESCGVADLVTACYFDCNRLFAEMFVTSEEKVNMMDNYY